MYNTAPPAVEHTLHNYCLYYASIIEIDFDEKTRKPIKATLTDVTEMLKEFLKLLCLLGGLFSIVHVNGYAPFGVTEKYGSGFAGFFEPRHLANNFFVACECICCKFENDLLALCLSGIILLLVIYDILQSPSRYHSASTCGRNQRGGIRDNIIVWQKNKESHAQCNAGINIFVGFLGTTLESTNPSGTEGMPKIE